MEDLAVETLRKILLDVPFYGIIRLSMTSVQENTNVARVLDVFSLFGENWWEDKISEDFPRRLKRPAGMSSNNVYFLNFAPLVPLVEYAVMYNIEAMLLEAARSIPSEGDLRSLASSEDIRVQDFIARLDVSPGALVRIGRTDLALKIVDRTLTDQYPSRYWNQVSGWLGLYSAKGDEGYRAIAERTMSHPEYYNKGSETLKSLIASGANAEAIEIALSGMKSVGGKKVGINDGGGIALTNAVKRKRTDIVRLLLDAGANPSIARGKAFSLAVDSLDYKTMKMLSDQPTFGNAHLPRRNLPQQGRERELIDLLALRGKVILS